MKHKNKRLAAVFLTLCMVLGLLPSMAFAEELSTNPPAIEQPSTVDKEIEENIAATEEEPVAEYAGEVAPLNAVANAADAEITTWAGLSGALYQGKNAVLGADITATSSNSTLEVPTGVEATLDLNGHTIDRGKPKAEYDGNVIKIQGKLTIKDSSTEKTGKITGGNSVGWTTYSAGAVLVNGGELRLEGGSITGNKSCAYGGGVSVLMGTFIMTGGSITNNTAASYGGGVAIGSNATVELLGGEIKQNTAAGEYGGGVYSSASFTVGGNIDIQANTVSKPQHTINNVQFSGSSSYFKLSETTPLTTEAKIGWTPATEYVSENGVKVAQGTNAVKYLDNFVSYDSKYIFGVKANDSNTIYYAPKDSTVVTKPSAATATFKDGFGNDVAQDALSTYVKDTYKNAKGYTFAGWFDADRTELTDTTQAVAGKEYTAKWTKDGNTVRTTTLDLSTSSGNTIYKNDGEGWIYYANLTPKELVLEDCTIDVADGNGINLPNNDVKLVLKGTNTITAGGNNAIYQDSTAADTALTISEDGSGSLNAQAADTVITTRTLTLESGTVTLTPASGTDYGVYANSVTFGYNTTGTLSAVGFEKKGILAQEELNIHGGRKITLSGKDAAFSSNGIAVNGSATVTAGDDADSAEVKTKMLDYMYAKYVDIAFKAPQYATAKLKLNGYTVGKQLYDATIQASDYDGFQSEYISLAGFSLPGDQFKYHCTKAGLFQQGARYYVWFEMPTLDGYTIQTDESGKPLGIELENATAVEIYYDSTQQKNYVIFQMNAAPADDAPTTGVTTRTKQLVLANADSDGLTDTNGNAITPENGVYKCDAEGWTWDNTNKILTLNGAKFEITSFDNDTIYHAIYLPAGSTIRTVKDTTNTVNVTSEDYDVISGNGDLTIDGEGTLEVSSKTVGISTNNGKITIRIPVTVSTEVEDCAIYVSLDEEANTGKIVIDSSLKITEPSGGAVGSADGACYIVDSTGAPAKKVVIGKSGGSSSGGSSGGGGSHSSNSSNSISVPDAKNGTVSVTPKSASKGADVTITVTPDKGYTLETLTVTDKDGKEIELTNQGNGKYTFKMPASKVDVKATFMEDNAMLNHFVDVSASAYYYDAVLWAAENGITSGIDEEHFSPDGICTRAQAVAFFWRFMGSPAPKTTNMPFTDVSPDSYYYDALLWAVENGIAKGTSDTTFSPDLNCSRGHIVSFLWRSQNARTAGKDNPFTDVKADAYYADAVLWAVQEDVTSGTSAVTFSPDADCTRAQIVTFLYRTYQGK